MVLRKEPSLADFKHPLLTLEACHRLINNQCETLNSLAAHVRSHGCDGQAQYAASNVMRYFDGEGRHHYEDEEQDLFPRMVSAAKGRNLERVSLLVDQLTHEHQEIRQIWLGLRKTVELIAHNENVLLDATEVDRLVTLYRAHMELEEAKMIPLAAQLLGAQELAAIAEAMAVRRAIRS